MKRFASGALEFIRELIVGIVVFIGLPALVVLLVYTASNS